MEQLGSPELGFHVDRSDAGTVLVTVTGELDLGNVDRLAEAVAPVIETPVERLVVDVSGLRFADSSAIALWVRWAKAVGQIELREASPLLRRIVTTMGLDQILRLEP